ncbi:MAG: outer membrane beta-barrel family protein [Prevotella sp.]|nr:outer membrane beta-barrel family protein [Prevotella sp.]MCM1074793.1 outer membrane beta-barrel family protein [Ruminococcus sp.]
MTSLSAQEQTDSILNSTELEEVVVEGRTQRIVKHGVQYTPDKRTKKLALDATNLLRHMNIPQLNVSPDGAVTTSAGKGVTFFIDWQPANDNDLKGLRPEDVLTVEVLQYPDDPRFQSAPYVVNYIMHKYEWGGYTKLRGYTSVGDFDGFNGLLYSKFAYKKWTFDAAGGGEYYHNNKVKSYSRNTFRDFYMGDTHIDELTRISKTDDYLRLHNVQWGSLRATYQTDKMYLIHQVGFSRTAVPVLHSSATVDFSEPILPSSQSFSKENEQSLSPSISGYYSFSMPKNNTVTVNWSFGYGSTLRNSSYRLGNLSAIINNNKEETFSPIVSATYSKGLGHNNTFRTFVTSYNNIYHTNYMGSYSGLQKLLSSENLLFLEYMQNWACGLSLYSRVGMSYVIGRINGVNELEQFNPRLGFQLRYNINQNHQAGIQAWWGNSHPAPSTANTAMVQTNELMWKQGNPDLKNTLFHQVTIDYTFIPNNKLSLSATLEYEGNPDKQAAEYLVIPGYNGLVQRVINSGTYYGYRAYISGTLKLFDNSLSIQARVQPRRDVLSGIDHRSVNQIICDTYVNWAIKNFGIMLDYSSPAKVLNAWSGGELTRSKSGYGIYLSYAVGNLNFAISFRNWFNSNKVYADYSSPHYNVYSWGWSSQYTRKADLTVIYTISYGKKVQRGNEIGGASGTDSAILK